MPVVTTKMADVIVFVLVDLSTLVGKLILV